MIQVVSNNDVSLAQRTRDREIMNAKEPRMFRRAISLPHLSWEATTYRKSDISPQVHYGAYGAGVNIYVLDTGVEDSHEIFKKTKLHPLGFLPNAPVTTDGHGHGTWLCGRLAEIAPQASIYSIKCLDDSGSGLLEFTNYALNRLICAKESLPHIVIVPIRDTECNARTAKLIWQLYLAGVSIIVSGDGNYLANYDGVIALSTTNKTRPLVLPSSEYSLHLALKNAESVGSYLNNTYRRLEGTSSLMATVAGILALGQSYTSRYKLTLDRFNILTQVVHNGALDEKSFLAAVAERYNPSLATLT